MGGVRSGVDTRSKILSLEAAGRLTGPLTLATGYFDVLRVEHARQLGQAGRPLLVAVVRHSREILDPPARAELVAALRVVDYVVTADHDELDRLIALLQPAEILRLEADDLRCTRRLIEDAQRRQTR